MPRISLTLSDNGYAHLQSIANWHNLSEEEAARQLLEATAKLYNAIRLNPLLRQAMGEKPAVFILPQLEETNRGK